MSKPEMKHQRVIGLSLALALLFALAAAFFAVTSQSLWIDEANSAVKAIAPRWKDFLEAMHTERGSDLQMPLYMAALWAWEKIVGSSEFALRAMNIPMFVIALATVAFALSTQSGLRTSFCIFATVSPMAWAYLDEARPYILQFMCSTMIMVGLVNLSMEGRRASLRNAALVSCGILLLCGSSLMGVIYSFLFGLAFVVMWLKVEPITATIRRPGIWALALGAVIVLAFLASYYMWTLNVGARASGVGRTNPMSMGFCAYELLGFSGLGPGRAELRDNPNGALRQFIPLLALQALTLGAFLVTSIKWVTPAISGPRLGALIPITASVVASAVAVTLIGIIADFRIIGRHLMPLLPFFLLAMSWCAWILWIRRGVFTRGIVVAILAVSLVSSLSLRLSTRFAKDDYRNAAATAREALAAGKIVWWAADGAGASYYDVALTDDSGTMGCQKSDGIKNPFVDSYTGSAYIAAKITKNRLESLPQADIVILSKNDVYDPAGNLRAWMDINNFKKSASYQSFGIWKRIP
jgi:hypothetical protein